MAKASSVHDARTAGRAVEAGDDTVELPAISVAMVLLCVMVTHECSIMEVPHTCGMGQVWKILTVSTLTNTLLQVTIFLTDYDRLCFCKLQV